MSCMTLLAVKPANAQSTPDINAHVPIPSVPEFTIKYVDHSYEVPTTTTSHTDPYTGEVTTEIRQGYHVKNFTIDMTIKNQGFPTSIDGNALGMRYFIQTKGHFENDWHETHVDTQSTSGYTTVAIPANSYPANGTVDFRVKAWLGYYTPGSSDGRVAVPASFLYPRASDWSNIQTLKIPESSVTTSVPKPSESTAATTPTATPTQTPPQTDIQTGISFDWDLDWQTAALIGMAGIIAAMAVGMVALWRKTASKQAA
jgi:hypothetical protein